jgi:hypothetical protein
MVFVGIFVLMAVGKIPIFAKGGNNPNKVNRHLFTGMAFTVSGHPLSFRLLHPFAINKFWKMTIFLKNPLA